MPLLFGAGEPGAGVLAGLAAGSDCAPLPAAPAGGAGVLAAGPGSAGGVGWELEPQAKPPKAAMQTVTYRA